MKLLMPFLALLLSLATALANAGDKTITYYQTDHLGSPVLATDNAGRTVWKEDYGPWGEQLLAPAGNRGDIGYTGHYTEAGLGLTYAQARWYDQVAGVFLSTDPVGFGDGGAQHFNRYVYAGNNPYGFMDPDGRERVGANGGFNFALGPLGYKFRAELNYDTESNEVGGSVIFGRRAGAKASVKGGIFIEPSSRKGDFLDAKVESNIEVVAEAKLLIFSAEASGKAFSNFGWSSEDGPYGDYDVEGGKSANWGPLSYDLDTGRASWEFGGGVGVSAGVDVEVSGNGSLY